MIHAEEAETSIALALGQRVLEDERTRDAFDRGASVKEAGLAWTSFGKYGMTHKGPGVVVPMDMLRDITVGGRRRRDAREPGDRRASRRRPRPPHRPGLQGDGGKGVARGTTRDRPLAASLARVPASPLLPTDPDPPPHPARGRGRGEAVLRGRGHHHVEPCRDARGRLRPLRPEPGCAGDRGDAARRVLRRGRLRRRATVPKGSRRHRRRTRAGGRRERPGGAGRRHRPLLHRPLQQDGGHAGLPRRVQRRVGGGGALDGRPRHQDLRRRKRSAPTSST